MPLSWAFDQRGGEHRGGVSLAAATAAYVVPDVAAPLAEPVVQLVAQRDPADVLLPVDPPPRRLADEALARGRWASSSVSRTYAAKPSSVSQVSPNRAKSQPIIESSPARPSSRNSSMAARKEARTGCRDGSARPCPQSGDRRTRASTRFRRLTRCAQPSSPEPPDSSADISCVTCSPTTPGTAWSASAGGRPTYATTSSSRSSPRSPTSPTCRPWTTSSCAWARPSRRRAARRRSRAIDHDAVVAVAEAAKQAGAQSFLHVTAMGANARSRVFYNRVKGRDRAGRGSGRDPEHGRVPALHHRRGPRRVAARRAGRAGRDARAGPGARPVPTDPGRGRRAGDAPPGQGAAGRDIDGVGRRDHPLGVQH